MKNFVEKDKYLLVTWNQRQHNINKTEKKIMISLTLFEPNDFNVLPLYKMLTQKMLLLHSFRTLGRRVQTITLFKCSKLIRLKIVAAGTKQIYTCTVDRVCACVCFV